MATRSSVTYESRVAEVKEKIREKPEAALREIGKFLVKEIRSVAAKSTETRTYTYKGREITVKPGRLKRSIGYWFRKKEGDLQVGSKAFYAPWLEFGSSKNQKKPFLMPVVLRNVAVIQAMIQEALKELEKEK